MIKIVEFLTLFKGFFVSLFSFLGGVVYQSQRDRIKDEKAKAQEADKRSEITKEIYEGHQKISSSWNDSRISYLVPKKPKIKLDD